MSINVFSMPPSSALLLFSLAFGLTNARPWQGATKTDVYHGDEWSPRPTHMPMNPRDLFKRDHVDVAVCGWIGGSSASPVACASGSSCVHDTIHGYVGCCTTTGPCTAGVYTSCVDQNSGSWGEDSGLVDTGIYTCQSGSYCYRNVYPDGYSQYNCGFSDQATTVETTFTGKPTDLRLQIVFTGVNFRPSAAPSSTISSSASTSSSQSSSSGSSISTSSNSGSSSKSSPSTGSTASPAHLGEAAITAAAGHISSNIKGIIGGVLGGLTALIALLGVLLFFLQRRHVQRNQRWTSSLVSGLKNGPPAVQYGPFERIGPYSPDDFQSSMTGRDTPSIIAVAFPNNHLTPLEPAAETLLPLPDSRDENGHRDDTPLVGNEFDNFARGHNEVATHCQSQQQERA